MKVHKFLSYIFFLILSLYTSKGNNIDINPTKIDVIVEKDSTNKPMLLVPPMPSFKGDLQKWLRKNIRHPEAADTIEGRVIVNFLVQKDGRISDIKILKGLHPLLDAEAIRLIRSMPRWNPALDIWTLKPKDERFTIAVVFKKRDKK